ncbi:AbrB/MazE/SpoVT family DNA-binding domain-containing protein [Desulfitobacterium hafniense]|uniref:AbrB/MazE/SpoVT family DNA-binding domain-containing protein n=1 Tax=Desulfitobacterium hafniense TaxID=49338 RepID=UPI0003735CAB|nr:AbrB/MazE/SpoVT family DNA-binding domain-containing protein [Desulfitobacterium hafniense]
MAKQLLSGKLTSKGQMTIPVELRNLLKLNEGDRLAFILNDKEGIIEVQPKTRKSIRGVMGALKTTRNLNADEAIDWAREERVKELEKKLMELNDEQDNDS